MNRNDSVSNSSSCPVCGANHDVLMISLENGGYIITRPFPKEEITRIKVTNTKRRATMVDLVDIFWHEEDDTERASKDDCINRRTGH